MHVIFFVRGKSFGSSYKSQFSHRAMHNILSFPCLYLQSGESDWCAYRDVFASTLPFSLRRFEAGRRILFQFNEESIDD